MLVLRREMIIGSAEVVSHVDSLVEIPKGFISVGIPGMRVWFPMM